MNNLFFYIRSLVGLSFLMVSGGFFLIGRDICTGFAALVVGVALLIPAWRIRFNPGKLPPPTPLKRYLDPGMMLVAFRWSMGFIFCIAGVGGIAQKEYSESLVVLSMGLLFVSPLDAIIFAHWQPLTAVTIMTRNTGIFIYFLVFGLYTEKESLDPLTKGSIDPLTKVDPFTKASLGPLTAGCLLAVAIILLFYKPAIEFFKCRKAGIPFSVPPMPESLFFTGRLYPRRKRKPAVKPGAQALVQPPAIKIAYEAPPPPQANPDPPVAADAAPNATVTNAGNERQSLQEAFEQLLQLPPQQRGYAFQDFLNKLFHDNQLNPRKAFRLTGEEIDGSFEHDGHVYLLEAKWQEKQTGQSDLLVFNGKVEGKSAWARGLFISYTGFSKAGLQAFARGKSTRIIGMDGNDIRCILNGKATLSQAINRKARRAVETNEFFVPIDELI